MRASLPILLLCLAGCQEPFGHDRHDLVGLRVAGISARADGDEAVQLQIAAVVDGRPWSEEPLTLQWHDATELDLDAVAALGLEGGLASGPAPRLELGSRATRLALVASDGQREWRGVVDLPDPSGLGEPPGIEGISARTTGRRVDGEEAVTGLDLDLENRRDWQTGEEVDAVEAGAFIRLAADGTSEGTRVRWMSTQPGGRFLAVDEATTDWAAATFVIDDEDVEDVVIEEDGARTILALALDPAREGANDWAARELFVGEVPDGVWTASGRFLPADTDLAGPWITARLARDEAAPSGLRLADVEAATEDTPPGTEGLPCREPVAGPFDPDWLLEQRCALPDVLDARVLLQVRP